MSNFSYKREFNNWNRLQLIIDGITYTVPGLSRVSVSVSRKLNKEKADSQDGEAVLDVGSNASSIKVSTLMSGYDYEIFCQQILPALKVKGAKGKDKNPITCNHPQLSAVGIQKILLDGVDLPAPSEGETEVSLSFVEASEPKKQKGGSKSGFGLDPNGNPIPKAGIPTTGIDNRSTYGSNKTTAEVLEDYAAAAQTETFEPVLGF